MGKFIDVSKHNGDINWSAVKSSGIEAVIIKSTEGTTFIDDYKEVHYNGARSVGLNVGFYHFYNFASAPETNAENFWNNIKDHSMQVKPCLDIEDRNTRGQNVEDCCNRFLSRFAELSGNMPVIIYSGRSYIEEFFSPEFCSDKHWWIAEYNSSCRTPAKCGTLMAWQHTETGRVSGVNGNCDVNDLYEPSEFYMGDHETVQSEPRQPDNRQVQGKVADFQRYINSLYGEGYLVVDNIYGQNTENAFRNNIGTVSRDADNEFYLRQWVQLRVGAEPDGIWGSKTNESVKQFQRDHGLVDDGVVGVNTFRAMCLA